MKQFVLVDWIIFISYAVIIVGMGLWVSRTKKGEEKTAKNS